MFPFVPSMTYDLVFAPASSADGSQHSITIGPLSVGICWQPLFSSICQAVLHLGPCLSPRLGNHVDANWLRLVCRRLLLLFCDGISSWTCCAFPEWTRVRYWKVFFQGSINHRPPSAISQDVATLSLDLVRPSRLGAVVSFTDSSRLGGANGVMAKSCLGNERSLEWLL